MDNIEACGVEVSARELVVARKEKGSVRLKRLLTRLRDMGTCCVLSPAGGGG
jgi:hypothetical protein